MSTKNISPTVAVAPLVPVAVQTGAYTAGINQLVPVDATSTALTVTLPNSPTDSSHVTVKKVDASTNLVTIATAGTDVLNKTGGATSVSLSIQNQTITLQYAASPKIWYVVSSDTPYSAITNAITTQINAQATFNSTTYVAKAAAGTTTGYVPAVQSDGSIAWSAPVAGAAGTPGDVASIYSLGTISSGTLNLSTYTLGGVFQVTFGANVSTITLPSTTASKAITLELVITQDATGSRTITFPAGTKFSEGNPPALSTVAGSIDTIALVWDGLRWKARLVERMLT